MTEILVTNKGQYIQKIGHMDMDFVWKLVSSLWIHILEDSALEEIKIWMSVFTLICILALFNRLRVVCLVLSGPRGTSCFSCSKYSRSLARLKLLKKKSVVVKLHPNSISYMQIPSVCRISVQNSIQWWLPFSSLWQSFRPKGHLKCSNAAWHIQIVVSYLYFKAVCSVWLVPS